MNFLLIFHDDQSSFDPDEIRRMLKEIAGISDLTGEGLAGSSLRAHFDFDEDKTTVRLAEDLKALSVHGTGPASLHLALELQRRHSKPLRVTDLDYGFDLLLGDIGSVQDFEKKIRDAYAVPDSA
jgi:hypothetical protein